MPLDGKVKFLRENIDSQVESFSRRRNSNKQKAFLVKLGTSAAAGTATVILGFQGYIDPVWAKNIALILSALITFVSAWDAYFNHRALWLRYTETVTELRSLLAELDYLTCSGTESLEEKKLDAIFHRYQEVLGETNSWWQNVREDDRLRWTPLSRPKIGDPSLHPHQTFVAPAPRYTTTGVSYPND